MSGAIAILGLPSSSKESLLRLLAEFVASVVHQVSEPPKAMAGWEHFSHGSDIGVRGFGNTIEEAFEQAALALTAIVAEISRVGQGESVEVHCDAPDLELLFVSWLNAIIYEMAVRTMLFSKFRVVLSGHCLTGTLLGEEVDPERHQVAVEAKGATVTALKVVHNDDGQWVAQCVVDV